MFNNLIKSLMDLVKRAEPEGATEEIVDGKAKIANLKERMEEYEIAHYRKEIWKAGWSLGLIRFVRKYYKSKKWHKWYLSEGYISPEEFNELIKDAAAELYGDPEESIEELFLKPRPEWLKEQDTKGIRDLMGEKGRIGHALEKLPLLYEYIFPPKLAQKAVEKWLDEPLLSSFCLFEQVPAKEDWILKSLMHYSDNPAFYKNKIDKNKKAVTDNLSNGLFFIKKSYIFLTSHHSLNPFFFCSSKNLRSKLMNPFFQFFNLFFEFKIIGFHFKNLLFQFNCLFSKFLLLGDVFCPPLVLSSNPFKVQFPFIFQFVKILLCGKPVQPDSSGDFSACGWKFQTLNEIKDFLFNFAFSSNLSSCHIRN